MIRHNTIIIPFSPIMYLCTLLITLDITKLVMS